MRLPAAREWWDTSHKYDLFCPCFLSVFRIYCPLLVFWSGAERFRLRPWEQPWKVRLIHEQPDPKQRRIAEIRRQALLGGGRSEEHTSELQSRFDLVCRLLLEKKKDKKHKHIVQHKQNQHGR